VDFAKQEIIVIRRCDDEQECLIPGMDIRQISFAKADALEDELSAFVSAVSSREVPRVSGRVGRQALMIALNIMDQIDTAIDSFLS
jgi:hypothetical protein